MSCQYQDRLKTGPCHTSPALLTTGLNVRLITQQPIAGLPVVSNLATSNDAIEIRRGRAKGRARRYSGLAVCCSVPKLPPTFPPMYHLVHTGTAAAEAGGVLARTAKTIWFRSRICR